MPSSTRMRGRRRGQREFSSDNPNPIDIHVGTRIRLRRILLGLSQQKLGEALGLTFQQVQKYERGKNRVGSSRMFELARVLQVPVAYFFEEMTPDTATIRPPAGTSARRRPEAETPDPMVKRETLQLVRAYYRIADPRVRKRLFEMTKALGEAAGR